jgi:hypothetical protein
MIDLMSAGIKEAVSNYISSRDELEDKLIKSQKVSANAALRMLNVVDPQSCVLGGAPRDWALGKMAKDLDIYLQGYPDESRESVRVRVTQALDLQPYEIEDVTKESSYIDSLDNGVLGVFNIKGCFMPIQIVLCDCRPIDMLNKFHGSLSKVAYIRSDNWTPDSDFDGFELQTTLEFDISKQFQVHLIKKGDDPKYIAKVQAKYPDYTPIYEA